ncbi:MAG: hypothetical protein KC609_05625 [Myxococcales bacterium]|nr:hypothetical protein [Myxococcales bacterium]
MSVRPTADPIERCRAAILAIVLAAVLFGLLGACEKRPSGGGEPPSVDLAPRGLPAPAVVERLFRAARGGDERSFRSCFSRDSRRLLVALFLATSSRSDVVTPTPADVDAATNPTDGGWRALMALHRRLGPPVVTAIARIGPKRQRLTLGRGETTSQIELILEGTQWRVDLTHHRDVESLKKVLARLRREAPKR